MKATSLKTAAFIAGSISLLAGNAMAQTATTGVVGYETLSVTPGLNFVGVRLHENPLASGVLESATANSVTDAEINLGALITGGATYILEIEDGAGAGVIQEITAAGAGTSITTPSDLSAFAVGSKYSLRPASTLASIFGAANESGLQAGSGEAGTADQIWIWNQGLLDFDKYYYDDANPNTYAAAWSDANTFAVVAPEDINLIYADGFVINSQSSNDIVVTGDLKSGSTEIGIVPGFNFVGSVAPVGANLETAFGANNEAGLTAGSGEAGTADQIWVWNVGLLDFDKYYYDDANPNTYAAAWSNANTFAVVTPASVALDSGYVILGAAVNDVVQGVPSYYAGL